MKNGIYNSIGGIVRLAVALAMVPLLIRIIGTDEFGIWSLTLAIVGITAVTEIGFSSAVTVFASHDLSDNNHDAFSETLTISLLASVALGIIIAIILLFGAPAIVDFFPKLASLDRAIVAKALQFGSLFVLVRLPQQVLIGVQQAFQRFGMLNAVLTVQSVLVGIGMIAVAVNGGRTKAFMIVQTVGATVTLCAHAAAASRLLHNERVRFKWNTPKSCRMLRFGFLNTISNIGSVMFTQCDRLIVGAFLDPKTLGIYAAITTITAQINTVSALPVQPLLGRATSFWTDKNRASQARDEIRHALQFNAILAFGIGGSVFVLAPIITRIVFHGAVDQSTILALQCASLIYALYSLNAPGYFILPAIGEIARHTAIQVLAGALSLLCIWIGATHWGLLGAVLGNFGFILTLLLTWMALKRLPIDRMSVFRWLKFPLLWMVTTVIAAALLPQKNAIACALFVISCIALCWWGIQQLPMAFLAKWSTFKSPSTRS